MDHVNIISKEAITAIAPEISEALAILGFLMIAFLLGCLLYETHRNKIVNRKVIVWINAVVLTIIVIGGLIGSIFFRVPTGRYKYKATIDEKNMTVAEYNEFMKAYNHSKCKNGIYYFEDWLEDYRK